MFNFTTQTVYNTITKATAALVADGTVKNANVITSLSGPAPFVRIGNTRFNVADILDIQVKMPTVENLASVTFDLSKVVLPNDGDVAEGTARVVLYIGLSMNNQDALYANDLVYKGKPLFVEFPLKKGETASALAKKVVAIANKYFLFTAQEKILNVTATGTEVKFEGVNGYLQIKKAILQKFDPEAKTVDCCTTLGDYVDVTVGVPVIYTTNSTGVVTVTETKLNQEGKEEALSANEVPITPGLEAFGDYNWIIHNLRLPTLANTNFWAPTKGEMPTPGATYVQVIIRLCKERDGIVGEIVGARAKSVTTHVLYVEKNAYTNTLASELSNLGTVSTDADSKLQTPFGDTSLPDESLSD